MKNFNKFFGFVAFFAIIGLSLVALSLTGCDNGTTSGGGGGGGGDPIAAHINGTWKSDDGEEIKFSGSNFEIAQNNKAVIKGTHTAAARSITASISMAVKELHGDFLNESLEEYDLDILNNQWYDKGQVIAAFTEWKKAEDPSLSNAAILASLSGIDFNAMFPTYTGTVDGDTLTVDGTTYTKAGGSNPGNNPGGGESDMTWTAVTNHPFPDPVNAWYDINAVAYGDGIFVAGGDDGKMAYSSDGINWTAVPDSTFSYGSINAIAYGGGKFVAAGGSGNIPYSTDGINWTYNYTNVGISTIYAIAYGDGKFVAGGYDGGIAYSTDGITWTAVNTGTVFDYVSYSGDTRKAEINCIAYGGGRFVAGGDDGKMAYSADGVTWTAADSKLGDDTINAIAYGGGRFIAAGRFGDIAYSANGSSWTATSINSLSSTILAIAYGNNRFVAGSGVGYIAYSANGNNWTIIPSGTGAGKSTFESNILAIAYGNANGVGDGTWVAVGRNGKMAYSTGSGGGTALTGTVSISGNAQMGQTLTADTSALGGTGTITYQWRRGTAVIGTNSTYTITAADVGSAITVTVTRSGYSGSKTSSPTATVTMIWTAATAGIFGTSDNIRAITYGDGKFVAAGNDAKLAYSANGAAWTAIQGSGPTIWSIAYGGAPGEGAPGEGGRFVIGGSGGNVAYSADGVSNWTGVTSIFGTSSSGSIYGIAYGGAPGGGGRFVAVGDRGEISYSADGAAWTIVSSNPFSTSSFSSIAYGGAPGEGGKFVAGGSGGKMAYSTNGETWTAVSESNNPFITTYNGGDNDVYGIAYGNNRFVAVGSNGKMAYSSDGVTWTYVAPAMSTFTYNIRAIAYGNDSFVAVGQDGKMAISPDGATWRAVDVSSIFGSSWIYAVAYGGGTWVAVGQDGKIAYSTGD